MWTQAPSKSQKMTTWACTVQVPFECLEYIAILCDPTKNDHKTSHVTILLQDTFMRVKFHTTKHEKWTKSGFLEVFLRFFLALNFMRTRHKTSICGFLIKNTMLLLHICGKYLHYVYVSVWLTSHLFHKFWRIHRTADKWKMFDGEVFAVKWLLFIIKFIEIFIPLVPLWPGVVIEVCGLQTKHLACLESEIEMAYCPHPHFLVIYGWVCFKNSQYLVHSRSSMWSECSKRSLAIITTFQLQVDTIPNITYLTLK